MSGFLAELGRRFAERWFALLVLPGLFYAGVAAVAFRLGHRNWADWRSVWDGLGELTADAAGENVAARTVVLLVALVPLSAALGVLAQGLSGPVERWLAGAWPWPFSGLAARRTRARKQRWDDARTEFARREEASYPSESERRTALAEAAEQRNAVALAEPAAATWLGDRLRAPALRVEQEYGLDLPTVWPRLWLLLTPQTREIVAESRRRLGEAMTLGGWALLYTALGARWWPAALIGGAAGLTAWRRGRAAAEVYAELVEATVDMNVGRLSRHLGMQRPAPSRGREISERLRKGR